MKEMSVYPFNMYLFQALYEWLLDMDLDPMLVFYDSSADAARERFLYIGARSVREAGFSSKGFQCLTSKNGKLLDLVVEWGDIRGIVIGDEASVEEVRGQEMIYWRDDHWEVNLPKLCSPHIFKRQRKVKIINKREHKQE